jgi:AbrB family looped-hinge helix DNA binding protein
MASIMTVKGQVTIPKKVRDALGLVPGDSVEFDVNQKGQIVIHKAGPRAANELQGAKSDRFEAARGKAQVPWRTDDLMALLRDAATAAISPP